MRAPDRVIAVSALAGIALLAAACGGGSSSAGAAASSAASRQPYLAYSRCMQTHGAPFWPNPVASITSRNAAYTITARILSQEHGPSWNAALSACARKAPSQLPFTEAQLAAARTRMLKVVACMRTHGFPSMPNPDLSPNEIGYLPPRGTSPGNPKFRAAAQACHFPSTP
jgi:hypothetical protein